MPTIGDTTVSATHALAGGGAGQVLTKNTGSDYDYGWTSPASLGVPAYMSANWYDNRHLSAASTGSGGIGANKGVYVPFYLARQATVTAFGISGYASGGGTGQSYYALLGINPVNLLPGPILGPIVSTTVNGTSGSFVTFTPSSAIVVPAGWNYFFAGGVSGISCQIVPSSTMRVPWGVGGIAAPSLSAVIAWSSATDTPYQPTAYPSQTDLTPIASPTSSVNPVYLKFA